MTTGDLLKETVGSARTREEDYFNNLSQRDHGRFILFGAGMLGRKLLAALRRHGIEPLAFADDSPLLQMTSVDGIPVVSPTDAACRWSCDALFVTTIFHPTIGQGMASRCSHLKSLGCSRVTNFLPLAWMLASNAAASATFPDESALPHYGADLPSRLLAHADRLMMVDSLWHDAPSREIFRQQLLWRLHADFSAVGAPAPDQYFPRDVLQGRNDEVFVDGGAYDGDTLRSMRWPFRRAWAIEPDPGTASKLRALNLARVRVCETALGRIPGLARFNAVGSTASARSDAGEVEVRVSTLDELLADEEPTFVKLDVEGDELVALQGGRQTLLRFRPVVTVCVYHRPQDLWEVPLFLKEVLPEHRFFLRIHAHDGFELVAYAAPPERCL